jgi:hypothetical protein
MRSHRFGDFCRIENETGESGEMKKHIDEKVIESFWDCENFNHMKN